MPEERLSGEFTQGPVEVNKPMALKNTYARKKSGLRRIAINAPASEPQDPAPVAAGIQSLFSLVSMMRAMNAEPAGSPLNPRMILSNSGVEVRFAGADGAVESMPAELQTAPEQILRVEGNLKILGLRVANLEQKGLGGGAEQWLQQFDKELREMRETNARLEEKLAVQAQELAGLRAAVQQNEEMIETLVDSMNMMDELGDAGRGPELVTPAGTLAS